MSLLRDNLRDERILRQSRALVTIVDEPGDIKSGAQVWASSGAMFSRSSQLINGISHTTGKMASFEPDFWQLDGSFMLPVAANQSQMEIGFVSSQISGPDGTFNVPPTIDIIFPMPQNLPQVAMVFDHTTGEIPQSVRIQAFDVGGMGILDETVTMGNNPKGFINGTRGANGVRRVVITILRMVRPFRRARVAEVHFGRVLQYDGEDIAQVSSVCQADAQCRTFPQNRLRFKIFNKERFGILGNQGDARHLRERQLVEYTQGIIDDYGERWTHCGIFALDSWQVMDRYVEFMALGRSSGLGNTIYHDSTFQMYSLGQMARDVATVAGFQVDVPRTMETSPFIPRFFGNVSHRTALMMIAQLASCLLYEDKNGVLCFVDIVDEPGTMVDQLDYERLYVPPKIELGTFYNGVMLTETLMTTEQGRVQHTEVEVAGSTNVMIPFDRPIFSGGLVEVAPGFSIANVRFHTMYMTATISGSGRCAIEIHGNRADFAHSETFYPAPWFTARQEQHPYVVNLPIFLRNMTHLAEVRSWFLRRKFAMLAMRVTATADWRQNPAIVPGDRVNLQVDRAGRMALANVVYQELDFDRGVLRGKAKVVAQQLS